MRVRGLVPRVARDVPPDETAVVQLARRRLVQSAPRPGERVARWKARGVGVHSRRGTCARHEAVSVVLRQRPQARRVHLQAAVRNQEARGQGARGEHAEAAAGRPLELQPAPNVRASRDVERRRRVQLLLARGADASAKRPRLAQTGMVAGLKNSRSLKLLGLHFWSW